MKFYFFHVGLSAPESDRDCAHNDNVLTMCCAANTPSTMAQQKAATTPKLMNTIAATSCNGRRVWVPSFYQPRLSSANQFQVPARSRGCFAESPLLTSTFRPRTSSLARPDSTLWVVLMHLFHKTHPGAFCTEGRCHPRALGT